MAFSHERGTPVDRVQTKHLWGRIHGGRVNSIKDFSVESSAKRDRQKFSRWMFLFSVCWPSGETLSAGSSQLGGRQPTVHATCRRPPPSPYIPQTSPCEAPLPPSFLRILTKASCLLSRLKRIASLSLFFLPPPQQSLFFPHLSPLAAPAG